VAVNRRAWLFLAVALVAAGSMSLGTSGFSSAAVDREVSVTVADDQASGFVPLADPGEGGTHPAPVWVDDSSQLREEPVTATDDRVPLFLVHNRFDRPLAVDTHFVWGELDGVSDVDSITLEPGETSVVTGSVDCGGHDGPRMVELNVTATMQEMTAHITYQVTVVCAVQTPTPTPEPENSGQSSSVTAE
jgi:hypothetical protein